MIVSICISAIAGEDMARCDPLGAHRHRAQRSRPRTKGWWPVQVGTSKCSNSLDVKNSSALLTLCNFSC